MSVYSLSKCKKFIKTNDKLKAVVTAIMTHFWYIALKEL